LVAAIVTCELVTMEVYDICALMLLYQAYLVALQERNLIISKRYNHSITIQVVSDTETFQKFS